MVLESSDRVIGRKVIARVSARTTLHRFRRSPFLNPSRLVRASSPARVQRRAQHPRLAESAKLPVARLLEIPFLRLHLHATGEASEFYSGGLSYRRRRRRPSKPRSLSFDIPCNVINTQPS